MLFTAIGLDFHHQTQPQLSVVSALAAPFFVGLLVIVLHSSPGAYWTPSDLGYSSSDVLYFCLFILFVHGVLLARILEWFAIFSSSGPHFVRTLHYIDPSILGSCTWHGLYLHLITQDPSSDKGSTSLVPSLP